MKAGRIYTTPKHGAVGQVWESIDSRPDGTCRRIQILSRQGDLERVEGVQRRRRGKPATRVKHIASWLVRPVEGTSGIDSVISDTMLGQKYRLLMTAEVTA